MTKHLKVMKDELREQRLREIARQVGYALKTVRRWAEEDNWDAARAEYVEAQEHEYRALERLVVERFADLVTIAREGLAAFEALGGRPAQDLDELRTIIANAETKLEKIRRDRSAKPVPAKNVRKLKRKRN